LEPFAQYLVLPSYVRMFAFRCAGYMSVVSAVLVLEISIISRSLIAFAVGSILSIFLLGVSRSLLARGALSWLKKDPRRPILYLRSFSSDQNIWETFRWMMRRSFRTYEQSLARAVLPLGPLVAIGKPGDVLPPAGAARLYVDHDHWQEVVQQLVKMSQFVILRIGQTAGFRWELEHLASTCEPEKLLVFLPAQDSSGVYEAFRQHAQGILPVELPPQTRGASFLAFDASWRPLLVGIREGRFSAVARLIFQAPISVLADALATLPAIRRAAATSDFAVPQSRLVPLASVLVGLALWEFVGELATLALDQSASLPTPVLILAKAFDMMQSESLWVNVGVSAQEFIVGYAIAAPLGLAIGYMMAESDNARRIIQPWAFWLYAMPALALAPALLHFAGIGFAFVVSVVVATVLFSVILTTADALPTPRDRLGGVSRMSRLPLVFKGMKQAAERGFAGVIAAEFFASGSGIGHQIQEAFMLFDWPGVYAAVAICSVLGMAFVGTLAWVEKRVARFTAQA
jgi:ABC-type nitrate/sulfonate/bicarbonate transport system permease component